jgi:hypothetical protein
MKSAGMIGWPGNFPGGPPDRRRLSAWLQEKLFARRIVLVTGWLDDAIAGEAAAALMTLDTIGDEPIELHLDSHDGALEAAFVLIDTLDGSRRRYAHVAGARSVVAGSVSWWLRTITLPPRTRGSDSASQRRTSPGPHLGHSAAMAKSTGPAWRSSRPSRSHEMAYNPAWHPLCE